jgi:hypothetical protein
VFAFSGIVDLPPGAKGDPAFLNYAVSLTPGDGRKRVCFIPTATGDSPFVIDVVSEVFAGSLCWHLGGLGQHGERVRACVRGQVVLGAGDGNGRDDGDAERRADLQGGVAEARGEPGLVPGDAGERRDRGGHEGQADPKTTQEQPEEDVREVAAVGGDLCEHERARAHERQAGRGDRAEADLEDRALAGDRAGRGAEREHHRADTELER